MIQVLNVTHIRQDRPGKHTIAHRADNFTVQRKANFPVGVRNPKKIRGSQNNVALLWWLSWPRDHQALCFRADLRYWLMDFVRVYW